jgi:hypothetical protein
VAVPLHRQSPAGKVAAGNVRKHAAGIDVDGMSARRLADRHAVIGDMTAEIPIRLRLFVGETGPPRDFPGIGRVAGAQKAPVIIYRGQVGADKV